MQKTQFKKIVALFLASSLALPLNAALAKGFFSRWTSQQSTSQKQAHETAESLYQVMMGEFLVLAKDYNQAHSLILASAQKNKSDLLFERAITIALYEQNKKLALETAQKWQAALPESKSAHHFALDLLIELKHFDQTPKAIQGMLQASPENTRVEMIAAMGKYLEPHALEIRPYYTQAMQPWLASSKTEETAAAWISIATIELASGDKESAYNTLTKAHTLAPFSREFILFAIDMITPSHPEIETWVQRYLETPDANDQIRLLYVQSLLTRGDANAVKKQVEILIKKTEAIPVAWFLLGSLQIEDGEFLTGAQTLKTYLAKSQDDTSPETQTNRDQAYRQLAHAEIETGKPQAAMQWIEKISNAANKEAVQNSFIAILIDQKKYDFALQQIAKMPEDTQEQNDQKTKLHVQVLIQAQRWAQAYAYLEKINSKSHAPTPHYLYLQSLAAIEIGKDKHAESLLRNLIKMDPTNASAMNVLGYLFAERNTKLDEAKELIQQSLKLEPNNPAALDSLGWVEFKRGNMDVALHLLERAYTNYPDPEVAAHYGQALWVSGQREKALAVWKIALNEDENNKYLRNTFKQLGIPLSKVKNFDLTGQENLQPVQPNLDEINAENFSQIIDLLYREGEWQKLYDVLASVNADNIAALLDLQAYAASELGQKEEAERLYRRAIEAEPLSGAAYNNLGYMLAQKNERLNEAKALIEKANTLEPNNAAFLHSLGWVELRLNNNQQAIMHLRHAYQISPEIAEIGIHLGEALWKINAKAEALLIWKDVQSYRIKNAADNQLLQETLNRLKVTLP